jgi:hypothetical protein
VGNWPGKRVEVEAWSSDHTVEAPLPPIPIEGELMADTSFSTSSYQHYLQYPGKAGDLSSPNAGL